APQRSPAGRQEPQGGRDRDGAQAHAARAPDGQADQPAARRLLAEGRRQARQAGAAVAMPGAATTAIALLAAASAAQGKATLALDGAVARGLRAQGVAVARQAVLPVAGGTFRNGAALRLRGKVTLRARSGGSVRRVTFTGWRAQVRGGTTKLTTV